MTSSNFELIQRILLNSELLWIDFEQFKIFEIISSHFEQFKIFWIALNRFERFEQFNNSELFYNFVDVTLIEILIFCCCAFLKLFEIRVHASLFLIFKMFFLYCSSTSSCRDSFVDFNDFIWFKFVNNVSYNLNHVNWFDT